MFDRRVRNIQIFEDTQKFCKQDILKKAIENSIKNTRIYTPGDKPELPEDDIHSGRITVTAHRTFEAAVKLHSENPGKRIAVLNFASATNPGGGVTKGAGAQEECLCRCSTLYPVLDTRELKDNFYTPNRSRNNLHDDTCIYTPDIVICKTDTNNPERLGKADFVTVDVMTCAAPNLRENPSNIYNDEGGDIVGITPDELYELHLARAKHIMHTAADNGADILVLGAFGCGAFRNDPKIVAAAYRDALKEYRERFDVIEFAVYCSGDTVNYDVFSQTMQSAGYL